MATFSSSARLALFPALLLLAACANKEEIDAANQKLTTLETERKKLEEEHAAEVKRVKLSLEKDFEAVRKENAEQEAESKLTREQIALRDTRIKELEERIKTANANAAEYQKKHPL